MTDASLTYAPSTLDRPTPSRSLHPGAHNRVWLIRRRGIALATFGVLAGLGGALATTLVLLRQAQAGMSPGRFALALWLAVPVAVVVGSRLLSLLLRPKELLRAPLRAVTRHGFSFQGGLLLVIAAVWLLARSYQLQPLLLLDTAVLGLPLGHALGRVGCHTYGCCHGRPTSSPWAIRYSHPDSKAVWRSDLGGVPLHPTQLYSVAGNLLLFGLLSWMATSPLVVGQLTGAYLALGSAGRFAIELFRGVPTSRWWRLTPFQWLASATCVAGIGLLAWTASGTPTDLFARPLASAFAAVLPSFWAPAWVCLALTVVFGIHRRRGAHSRSR